MRPAFLETIVEVPPPKEKKDEPLPVRDAATDDEGSPRASTWTPTKPQPPPRRQPCSPQSLRPPRRTSRVRIGEVIGFYTAIERCLSHPPKSPRDSNKWHSRNERVSLEHEVDLASSESAAVRWCEAPKRPRPARTILQLSGEAKYDKMLTWLRKRGKGHALDTDIQWLRIIRRWFDSAFDDQGKISIDKVQGSLVSAGVVADHDDVEHALDAHGLLAAGNSDRGQAYSFFDFVDFVLEVDNEGCSRKMAEKLARRRRSAALPAAVRHRPRTPINDIGASSSSSYGNNQSFAAANPGIGYSRKRQMSEVVKRMTDLDRLDSILAHRIASKH